MSSETPRILTDPKELAFLRVQDCPMLVLSDNVWSWISWRIKGHTSGHYNHAMWLLDPAHVASQGWRFRMGALRPYLNGRYRLKFWRNPNWTPEQRLELRAGLLRDLRAGGRYDWLGIIGQRLGLRWINFTNRSYCSEQAGKVLGLVEPTFRVEHPSPADLDKWCKDSPQMKVWGVFDPTL